MRVHTPLSKSGFAPGDAGKIFADALRVNLAKSKHFASQDPLVRNILVYHRTDLLCKEILGYEVKPFHEKMIRFQTDAFDGGLQLGPRGFGKSTVLTIAPCILDVIINPNIRVLLTSNTQSQADVFLREIKDHFRYNEKLKEKFGEFYSEEKWDSREIRVAPRTSFAKESTITSVGIGGPIASRHYDLIFADDLVDEENAWTEGQREKVKTWFYKTLLPCLEPHGRLFVIGTRYHPLDLYGYLIKNEFKDKHQIVKAIDEKGATPWPEKFSLEWLEKKREAMGSAIFNSQYQNDVELMKGNIFHEEWFQFYEHDPDWTKMHFFIGCDPAATRKDTLRAGADGDGDFWTTVVGAREYVGDGKYTGPTYCVHAWRDRVTKQAYVDHLKRLNEKYKPQQVLVETVAAQEYLAQDLEGDMPIERLERTKDKVARAYWLQPFFENGQIVFPDKSLVQDYRIWQALIDELILFPSAEHDDLFDGLQTMVEGTTTTSGYGYGGYVIH